MRNRVSGLILYTVTNPPFVTPACEGVTKIYCVKL